LKQTVLVEKRAPAYCRGCHSLLAAIQRLMPTGESVTRMVSVADLMAEEGAGAFVDGLHTAGHGSSTLGAAVGVGLVEHFSAPGGCPYKEAEGQPTPKKTSAQRTLAV
jgi:hypothetical protein